MVVVFSMAMVSLAYISMQLAKNNNSLADLAAISTFRRSILTFVTDDPSWKATVSMNGSMACLANGGGAGCTPFRLTTFNLFDASGRIVYNSTNAVNGINLSAIPCGPNSSAGSPYTTYRYPSANCQLQFTLQWAAMDNNPYPVVAITASLRVGKNGSGMPYADLVFNPNVYSFPITGPWSPVTGPPPGQWPTTLIYRRAVP